MVRNFSKWPAPYRLALTLLIWLVVPGTAVSAAAGEYESLARGLNDHYERIVSGGKPLVQDEVHVVVDIAGRADLDMVTRQRALLVLQFHYRMRMQHGGENCDVATVARLKELAFNSHGDPVLRVTAGGILIAFH